MSETRAPIEDFEDHVEDVDSYSALARIAMALPPVERAYALARFTILRSKLLTLMSLMLPEEGRILDVGCGFGLFSGYFSLVGSRRRITGVDPNARRVEMARNVARSLGLKDNQYLVGTVGTVPLTGPYDGIFMLDVLHHVPRESQLELLESLKNLLAPSGVLIIKDITTDSPFKLKFTELLDRVMAGWNEPLAYRHHREWASILRGMGFKVRIVRVPDILPYPHIVIVARFKDD